MLNDQRNRAVTHFSTPQEVDRQNYRQNRRIWPSADLEVGDVEGSRCLSHHHKTTTASLEDRFDDKKFCVEMVEKRNARLFF